MEFGPEIKVDGVRPEWLKDDEVVMWKHHWSSGNCSARALQWGSPSTPVDTIRLPANHPHYNLMPHTYTVRPEDEAALLASDPLSRSTPDERAVAPELVGRMRKLVEAMALSQSCTTIYTEARAIVAALEPVDPDVAEADAIMAMDEYKGGNNHVQRAVIAAIKRGRQLEKEGK